MPRKKQHVLTIKLDTELYNFLRDYCEAERETMAGHLRKYVLALKRAQEEEAPYRVNGKLVRASAQD